MLTVSSGVLNYTIYYKSNIKEFQFPTFYDNF